MELEAFPPPRNLNADSVQNAVGVIQALFPYEVLPCQLKPD